MATAQPPPLPALPAMVSKKDNKHAELYAKYEQSVSQSPTLKFTRENALEIDGQPRSVTKVCCPKTGQQVCLVVPNILNEQECGKWIESGEAAGIKQAPLAAGTLRTAKRTKDYVNKAYSTTIEQRISKELRDALRETVPSSLSSTERVQWRLHENWRFVRYDAGDVFQPHVDQRDSIRTLSKDNKPIQTVSFYTMIISLSDDYEGGCTSFYPTKDYNHRIDISLPKGWALLFYQPSALHGGSPVTKGTKYIAQAGLMRPLVPEEPFRRAAFKFGPGIREEAESRAVEAFKKNPELFKQIL